MSRPRSDPRPVSRRRGRVFALAVGVVLTAFGFSVAASAGWVVVAGPWGDSVDWAVVGLGVAGIGGLAWAALPGGGRWEDLRYGIALLLVVGAALSCVYSAVLFGMYGPARPTRTALSPFALPLGAFILACLTLWNAKWRATNATVFGMLALGLMSVWLFLLLND